MSLVVSNGSTQSVRAPRSAALEPAAVSIMAWFKRVGGQDNNGNIARKTWQNNGAPTFCSYGIQDNPGGAGDDVPAFTTGSAGAVDVLNGTAGSLPTGVWVHVVGTFNPAGGAPQKIIYINAVLNASKTDTSALVYDATATGDIYIGQNGNTAEFANGSVADVRVYNRALTLKEIEDIYFSNGEDTVFQGLVSKWIGNEGPVGSSGGAGSIKDVISKQNGTPQNGLVWGNDIIKFKRRSI